MRANISRKSVEFLAWCLIVAIGFSARDGVSLRQSVIWPLLVVSTFWFVCLYGPASMLLSGVVQRKGVPLWGQVATIGLFTLAYEGAAIWFFASGLGVWPGAYVLAIANALLAASVVYLWGRPRPEPIPG